jgi:hypothetical protein
MKNTEYDSSLITHEGVDALLRFLPYFVNIKGHYGTETKNDNDGLGNAMLTKEATEFCEACYENKFVQDFNWSEWSQSRQKLISSGDGIEDLDLADIGRLLTAHIRGDRFCDGRLLAVMHSGQMTRILKRLVVLNGKEKKQTRAPKQLGDFGEGLVTYALIRKGFEVANVDHVGADLIAEKRNSRFAISVKTRLFKSGSKESLDFQAEYQHLKKVEYFASQFGMEPMFALVICIADESAIHLLLCKVKDIRNHLPKAQHGFSFRFSKAARQKLFDLPFMDHSCWAGEVIGGKDFD